ncbi:hypothetical protein VP01_2802g4 [Puccinia sorghi]|uniref:Uncharacterized protein n=1 Tax=Puccinia sorghi TaxID=27349 RepID=A0A0L6V4B7_9BASI|nr:hypothetical protein VP01_2802g4 [Puccinia sorghi]
MSAGSLQDEIGSASSTAVALPPWSTDPSPRIYRVDAATNSALDTSEFKPPSHDDLILPTVARQIEKQTKLLALNDTDHPTYSSVSSHFPQWEALGPQLLLRKASIKQLDSNLAPHSSSHSSHEPLSSQTRAEELLTPSTPGSGWPRGHESVGRGDETTSPRRMSRGVSSSGSGSGPNSVLDGSQEIGLGGLLSPRSDGLRRSQQQQQQQASSIQVTSPIRQQPVPEPIRSPQRDSHSENSHQTPNSSHPPDMHPPNHLSSQDFPPNNPQSHTLSHNNHQDQVIPIDQDSQACCKCIIV